VRCGWVKSLSKKIGKTAGLHTFFKIGAGRTTHLFDPNNERKFFTDISVYASFKTA
jgi:hypothetical protein